MIYFDRDSGVRCIDALARRYNALMDIALGHTISLLGVAILVAMLARRLSLPYTVGLVVTGIGLAVTRLETGAMLTHDFILDRAPNLRLRVRGALMDVRGGRPIDQQAEQLGAAVVTARVHESFAGVDLGEVEISDHFAFASLERLADDLAVRAHDGGAMTPVTRRF
jgi:hypothetical protein